MGAFIDHLQIATGVGLITFAHGVLLPPLFGGPVPSTAGIAGAVVVGLVGCLLAGRGIRNAIVRRGSTRPEIDPEHDHTLDWITRP